MPDFTYRGAGGGSSPGLYPMLRDGFGVLIGTAEPGDIARFDEAPDADWEPYEGGGGNPGGSGESGTGGGSGEPGQVSGADGDSDAEDGEHVDDTAGSGQEEAD